MGTSASIAWGLRRVNIVPAATNTPSGSSNAFKGCTFTPSASMTLRGLYYCGPLINGGTYKGAVVTVSAGAIATITSTVSIVAGAAEVGASAVSRLAFTTPVPLLSGVTYGLIVGRTDSTDTFILPIMGMVATACASDPAVPAVFGDSLTVAENDPIVGTAVTASVSAVRLFVGVSVEF